MVKSCSKCCSFLCSTVGKKFVMGLTGLLLAGFVLVHMAGNMIIIFKGPDAYNQYGHMLTSNELYPFIGPALLGLFIVHILTAIWITKDNVKARPLKYAGGPTNGAKRATLASRTMIYSGAIITAFLILHLITFKYGRIYEISIEGHGVRDLARLFFEVFHNPTYVAWYLVALVFLAIHLKHGVAAAFQSLGFWHPRYTPMIKCLAVVYAIVVTAGFMSQPIYAYFFHK